MNDKLPLLASTHPRRSPFLLVLGLLVIASGAAMLADRFGLLNSWTLFNTLWPIGLIVLGIAALLQSSTRPMGVLSIVAGALLFARERHWIDFDIWQIIPPILLLWIGGIIVWRAFSPTPFRPAPEDRPDNYISSNVVFSGTDLRPVSRSFTGANLSSVFGGIKLDLSDADIQGDTAVIDLFAMFGGIELHVPSNWTVRTDTAVVMAGLSDNRRPTNEPSNKTLILRGTAIFAGVDIRN
jgi:predicted membrane protein